ncbi:Rhomboid- protein 3 [Tritrichomonas musculus]|uniref:Rhomboid- protein 3 n=1 Tax=Tritrichomonas musculus TaxID=1915356 RepID=A0ABR2GV56_9EUKA
MSDQPLTDAEREGVRKLVLHYDKSGNGTLEYDEFMHFLKALPNVNLEDFTPDDIKETDLEDLTADQVRIYFDGMDMDGTHSVNANEICDFINSRRAKDFKWQTKMIFRAADKDKSRKVSFDELAACLKALQGMEMTKEDFQNRCKVELGKSKKELEYWEFYKIISGQELDHTTDPYDGKIEEKKSSCCLLI